MQGNRVQLWGRGFSYLNYRSLLHEQITLSDVLQEELWMRFVTVKLKKEGYSMLVFRVDRLWFLALP